MTKGVMTPYPPSSPYPSPTDTTSENTDPTLVRFLELFRSSYFADVSLDQWMALTPPELVSAHLKLDQQVMAALRKSKAPVVPA
jgi:oxalate decarboxylase